MWTTLCVYALSSFAAEQTVERGDRQTDRRAGRPAGRQVGRQQEEQAIMHDSNSAILALQLLLNRI